MKFIASLILITLAAFTGTAFAADVANDPAAGDLIRSIFDAVVHGQWWPALCTVVVLACALEHKYAPDSWKTGVKGDIMGIATAFFMAFAASLGAASLAAGATMSFALVTMALKVGAGAIAGYTVLSRVLAALASWSKTPVWAQPIVAFIASAIGSKTTAAEKIEEAEKAGDDAVAANPSTGMAGDGKIREVE